MTGLVQLFAVYLLQTGRGTGHHWQPLRRPSCGNLDGSRLRSRHAGLADVRNDLGANSEGASEENERLEPPVNVQLQPLVDAVARVVVVCVKKPSLHLLSWDGEGRRGRHDRLVDGGNECNDPKEDEGTEARGAVHRLVRDRSSEHTLSLLLGCWVAVTGVVTGASSLAWAEAVVRSVVFVSARAHRHGSVEVLVDRGVHSF